MSVPLRPHHVTVVVAELGRSEQFYAGVLGLPIQRRLPDAQGAPRSIWLDLSGAFLALERAAAPLSATRSDGAPGFHCVALAIQPGEREGWRRRFAEAGIPIERESAYTIYVRDPDGNLVGLSHYPDPAPGG